MFSGSTESESASAVEPALSTPAEVKALLLVQRALADKPGVRSGARALSHFGEHSLGWMGIGAAGTAVALLLTHDDEKAQRWLEVAVGAFGAHALSVVVKRVVRRPRPHDPRINVGVGTPSKLSFPSSHATSTTAAAVLIGRAAGAPSTLLPAVLVPPMLLSRLVLGVHYPTDVLGGAALGAASAAAVIGTDKIVRRRFGRGWLISLTRWGGRAVAALARSGHE